MRFVTSSRPFPQRPVGHGVELHEPRELVAELPQQLALGRVGQAPASLAEVRAEGNDRALEDRSRAAAVVAVGGLPAVHVGHAELELARERLVTRPLAHLVEAVTQVGLALQRDRDRDQRPDDGQDDRRVQLGPDRHPAAAA